jgi:hypothetical protein
MPTIILRPGEASPNDIQLQDVSSDVTVVVTTIYVGALEAVANDIKLLDPTVQPAAAASEFTGTLVGLLSQITGSATASHGVTSMASGTLTQMTAAVSASHGVTGTASSVATQIVGSAAAVHGVVGTASGVASSVTGNFSGEYGSVVEPAAAGGGGAGPRSLPPPRRWRDPLYQTAELQAELTEDEREPAEVDDQEYAGRLIASAILVFGGLLEPAGGLVKVPPLPPPAVARVVVAAPDVTDWSDVLEAIKEARRRSKSQAERIQVERYRVEVEMIRAKVARMRDDDQSIGMLMAEGWL